MNIPQELNYRDVYLTPQKCIVNSREECNTSVELGDYTFSMPVYAANMRSIVNEETCKFFAQHNWFYTMHRFGIDPLKFIQDMHNSNLLASISVGLNDQHIYKIMAEQNLIPEYITIDIANAWTDRVKDLICLIKEHLPNTFLIVGNIATPAAIQEMNYWGANAFKVGIAGGAVCSTKNKTGFHRPMISTIFDCARYSYLPIIADGGIEEHGDIAKALAAGASMVMAGHLFAGYDESAGDIMLSEQGHRFKEYFGSASEFNKAERKNIEGKKVLIDYKGSMNRLLQELKEDLRSSISYAGGTDLSSLQPSLLLKVN